MELFGFGTPSELATPIGQMIKHTTDNLRLVPDWSKNLEICDIINRRTDNIESAMKAIHRRLQDSNQQTVYLSLILLETCMKNCGTSFASSFDRHLMDEVVKIAKGSKGIKNSDEALRLIQQWGRVFESRRSSFPLFFDTFVGLKSKGVVFPPEDENPISGYDLGSSPTTRRPSQPASAPAPVARQPARATRQDDEDDFFRLQRDMIAVMDKVKLCREMLLESPGIESDEALADVVGFLEACRDRMVDVIEAGTNGLLGEELFSQCLKVNDAILRTLEAERTGTRIAVEDEEEGEGKTQSTTSDNLLDMSTPKGSPMPSATGTASKTTLDKDLQSLNLATASTPASAPVAPAPVPSIVADPFDDPFSDKFNQQKPHPLPVAPTPAPSMANVFENNPFADSEALPPAPANVHKADDFELFLQSTATAVPPPAPAPASQTQPSAVPAAAEEDFDAFFANLNK